MVAEKTHRLSELGYKEREVSVREAEAESARILTTAKVQKLEQETAMARIQTMASLLKSQKELTDSGVSMDKIDAVLPLPGGG